MPVFSKTSRDRLAGAHSLLQALFNEAIKRATPAQDFMILDSQRGRAAQEDAVRRGASQAHFGQSAHNWNPSVALDVAPYPLDWNDRKRFIDLGRDLVMPLAKEMKIPIRWGADFNMNGDLFDKEFKDLPHYELHPWRDFAKQSKLFGT